MCLSKALGYISVYLYISCANAMYLVQAIICWFNRQNNWVIPKMARVFPIFAGRYNGQRHQRLGFKYREASQLTTDQ